MKSVHDIKIYIYKNINSYGLYDVPSKDKQIA